VALYLLFTKITREAISSLKRERADKNAPAVFAEIRQGRRSPMIKATSSKMSGWGDLNSRLLRPERSALPDCATSRFCKLMVRRDIFQSFFMKYLDYAAGLQRGWRAINSGKKARILMNK
jgi:hypothetical protein